MNRNKTNFDTRLNCLPWMLLLLSACSIVAGCDVFFDSSVNPPKYFVAFSNPPKGLTWEGKVISDRMIVDGSPHFSAQNAFDLDNGELKLFSKPFTLDGQLYEYSSWFSVSHHSRMATDLGSEVVVFYWKMKDENGEYIGTESPPNWLDKNKVAEANGT